MNNYKFEGKERDSETGNDDFGARYYSSNFGRWLSPDWSSVPSPVPYANLANPQTLNLYAMVEDDPESFADLDGHQSDPNVHAGQTGCNLDTGNGCPELALLVIGGNGMAHSLGVGEVLEEIGELIALQDHGQFTIADLGISDPAQTQHQAAQYGRQPDGSYRADTGPGSEIGRILDPVHPSRPGPIGNPSECVIACRHYARGLPDHTRWRKGIPVVISVNGVLMINPAVKPGTAIATFVGNRYPGDEDVHKNSGIFLGPALTGPPGSIRILDQWPGSPGPRARDMWPSGGYGDWDRSNHSVDYSVITVP